MIRPAVAADLPALRDIERAAGEAFRAIGMPEIADDEPLPVDVLAAYAEAGRAWVAVPDAEIPGADAETPQTQTDIPGTDAETPLPQATAPAGTGPRPAGDAGDATDTGSATDASSATDTGSATDAVDETPVAYLIADVVDGCLHIEQVSVHPRAARRGIGRSLIEHAAAYARSHGHPALTLTTFADVAWNAPYYERCGFRVVPAEDLTDGLRAVVQHEVALGLTRWTRVVMRREI